MALPVYRAASAKATGTTGATAVALPTGVTAGDIVILCATTIAGGSITISTAGSITTWTEITSSGIDVTGGEKLYVWWGRYTSGSTGPSVTPGSDHVCAGTVAYSGCVPNGSPIGTSGTGTEVTSDTSFSFATGLTTGEIDTMCICVCSHGNDSNTATIGNMTNASLGALANRQDFSTTSGGGGGFSFQEGTRAVAGTMGTFASTLSAASPKAYVAFNLRPTVPQSVTAGVGVTTLTGFSSTVSAGANQTASSGVGVVTLTGLSPVLDSKINAGVGVTTLTGLSPVIGLKINTDIGVVTLTGYSPTVSTSSNITVDSGVGVATLTGLVPQVNLSIATGVGEAALTGVLPTITASDNKTVSVSVGQLIVTGFTPTVTASTGSNVTVNTDLGLAVLAGFSPAITATDNKTIATDVGVLTLNGSSPSVQTTNGQTVTVGIGAVDLTGYAPSIINPVSVVTELGELILAGYSPDISVADLSIIISSGYGELILSGFIPDVKMVKRPTQVMVRRQYWK